MAVATAALSASPAFSAVHGQFERTLAVSGSVNLQIETGTGSIDVRRAGSNQVHVVGHIQASEWFFGDAEERVRRLENNPPIQQSGNDIRIGHIDDPELKRNISVSYEITVPESTELRTSSGTGEQSISDIHGPIEVTTGSGSLKLSRIGSSVRAHTGTGNIDINGANGSVRVEGEATGGWVVHTGSGSVDLRLPQNASFDLDAHTASGSINLSHPVTVQGSIGRKQVRGKVGGGGVPVEVETGSGSIRIE
jgi:DUF4097 and DUF4098 domain-containing protein YvlB